MPETHSSHHKKATACPPLSFTVSSEMWPRQQDSLSTNDSPCSQAHDLHDVSAVGHEPREGPGVCRPCSHCFHNSLREHIRCRSQRRGHAAVYANEECQLIAVRRQHCPRSALTCSWARPNMLILYGDV